MTFKVDFGMYDFKTFVHKFGNNELRYVLFLTRIFDYGVNKN